VAFRGQYEHSLDSKDRLTIPARFRESLAQGVVLAAGLDPCVEVYPPAGYAAFEQEAYGRLHPLDPQARMLRRRFNAGSHDDDLDSAGRVRIPRHLIEYAGLKGSCVVIGVTDHLEIWDAKRWAEHYAEINESAAEMAAEIARGATGG
jgi:MraZ protein